MLQRGEARAGQVQREGHVCAVATMGGRTYAQRLQQESARMRSGNSKRAHTCGGSRKSSPRAAIATAAASVVNAGQAHICEPATATAGAAAAAASAVGAVGCVYQGRSKGMAKTRAGDHKQGPGSANKGQGAWNEGLASANREVPAAPVPFHSETDPTPSRIPQESDLMGLRSRSSFCLFLFYCICILI